MTNGIRALLVAIALTLVAAACTSDSDDAATDDGGSATTADAAATTTAAATDTTAPEATEAPATTTGEVLPASFRGVTETSIKVGVAVPDFDALQDAGIGNYQGDAEIAFQAFFDVINDAGGIFGRQIEPVYVPFDFLTAATQDTACTRLAEDEEVFIVLYGLLGENNLCLTDTHDTMVMTRSFQTTDLRERSGETLWLQLNASDDARTRIMGQTLAEAGRLDGATIGIVATGGATDGPVLQDTLAELGFESSLALTEAEGSDPLAVDTELGVFAERFEADGVDFVFELRGGGNTTQIFADNGYTPTFAHKALGAAVDGAADRALMDGALGVGEIDEQRIFDDADFQANCMDVVLADNPELAEEFAVLPDGDQQAAGQPNWVNPVMIACDQTMLLKQIGEIAGADLTNDSFRAALDQLGPVDLNGYGAASFRSGDKWDGLDEFYILEFDAAADAIQIIGDAIVVDR